MKRVVFLTALVCFFMLFSVSDVEAQCAMCRTAIENDQNVADGVNKGILYLMGIPYIFLMITGYFIYKRWKERKASGEE